jgi:hypothetical protein
VHALPLTLAWTPSSGATSYEYCYDTVNNDACNGSWISVGSSTNVMVSGLPATGTYYWQVRARNTTGLTDANSGSWWSFTMSLTPPGAFAKSSPLPEATGQRLLLTMTWGGSAGATGYEYCYDTTDNDTCDASWLPTGSNTSVAVNGLLGGTTYYWQVRATNAGGTTYANGGSTWSFTTATRHALDFFGAGRSDIVVWRPDSGVWFIKRAATDYTQWSAIQWGVRSLGDRPVAADYDGDGLTDIAVWRESTGTWYVKTSSTSFAQYFAVHWGAPRDRPVEADYDGDGRADLAVWRPANGTWYVLTSSSGFTSHFAVRWGSSALHDVPVPGDFDGDARADIAVWRADTGMWYVKRSTSAYATYFVVEWGSGSLGDVPTIGDFDGDARADIAIWRPGSGKWYVKPSSTSYSAWFAVPWGAGSLRDVPVMGDFDGDNVTDLAVWRPGVGGWYIKPSSTSYGTWFTVRWGQQGDKPIGAASR